MSRKKKPLPLWENITIEDIAAEGKAIAHVNDLVVFVPFAVPGDVVDLQVRRKKHSFAEAEVVKFHKLSDKRSTPFCPHFGVCGGCKWQILPYEEQLKYKQKQVSDQLRRIGGIDLPEISPILGSIHTREYRNKLEFGCSDKRWLTNAEVASGVKFDDMNAIGFHIPGAFDKILDISECHLMDSVNNRIRSAARKFAKELGLTLYNARSGEGMLRGLMLRNSATTEIMLLVQFSLHNDDEHSLAMQFMEAMKEAFPEITSLLYVNNTKCNDVIYDLPVYVYAGSDHIYETMEGLRFKVGPKSFYQTNTEQAYELYKVAR
ncbi:MAG: class I SAM-dependent RNA methyltransferase, partial [Bacteroidaceae bacterium]|nr:class I SAM-dependent RNA methyltransferase [Bacteroidaceae bacterium]